LDLGKGKVGEFDLGKMFPPAIALGMIGLGMIGLGEGASSGGGVEEDKFPAVGVDLG